jgi:hypothetical protein
MGPSPIFGREGRPTGGMNIYSHFVTDSKNESAGILHAPLCIGNNKVGRSCLLIRLKVPWTVMENIT